MPVINGDLEFFDGSGVISVTNGDLTIRTDDPTRSIIVASGAALRSDRDIASDLGTSNLRWHAAHIGNLFCASGEIAGLTMTDSSNTFDVDVTFNGVNTQFINSATVLFDDFSNLSIAGNVFIGGSTAFQTRSDLLPWIDAVTSLGNADVRWARVHVASGIFNTISPVESGSYIQVNGSLSPSEDAQYVLGGENGADASTPSRWADVYAASGHFNAIFPQVSGTGVGGNPDVWIQLGGSLIPSLEDADLFWFGHGKNNRHAGVDVASGIFDDVEATTADITTLDVGTLNFDSGGDIVNTGLLDWDLGASTTTISNGTWVFDGTTSVQFDSPINPGSDALYDIGTTSARWAALHAVSGIFDEVTATTGTITTLGSTTITATTINSLGAMNCFGTFGTVGLASLNGGTFFGNAAAPSSDAVTSFGLQGFRWGNIYSVSGQIEALSPRVSGASLLMHGHFVPGLDSTYDLGTTDHKWGAIHATSGVFDNLQVNEGVAEYFLGSNTGSFTTTLTTVPFDQTVIEDSNYYSMAAGVVTINTDGLYSISYGTNISQISGNSRSMCSGQLTLNGTDRVRQSAGYVYSREDGRGEGTISKTFLLSLTATDTIRIQSRRENGAGTFEHLEGSNLSLRFIR